MNPLFRIPGLVIIFFGLPVWFAGCQSQGSVKELKFHAKAKPPLLIESLAKSIKHCWFGKKSQFSRYRLANEVTSHTGRPRLLFIPNGSTSGLPALVIQAQARGSGSDVLVFGPLMASPLQHRIENDIKRWVNSPEKCQN